MDGHELTAVGEVLRRHRLAAGLTQEALAERAGVSAASVSGIERGLGHAPRRDTLRLLADVLGLSPEERAPLEAAARPRGVAATSRISVDRGASFTLPKPLTPLIGREAEVATAVALLRRSDVRLVTMTGIGGVGKTRLALAVAEALSGDFGDGVCFVDLAPVAEPGQVVSTLARALRLREDGSRPLVEIPIEHLRDRRILLVLDNVEHLLAAAPVVADLLIACRELHVLATSREPLRVRGERELTVAPLALPERGCLSTVEALSSFPAVTLFVRRAQAVRATFSLDAANAPAVAEICRRLDGLPLAIELAAARGKLLEPPALLARLERRLLLLTGGPQDAPDRQRTLRDTLAWSYRLLHAEERALLRRLAVFAGGCTLAAAEAVCMADGELRGDVLEWLGSLVDKSLLVLIEGGDAEPRFGMLETVREYALEQLMAAGEEETVRRQHATYYLALAEEAAPELAGAHPAAWLMRLEREHENLRAVLGWAQDRGDAALGLRLATTLWRFWYIRGYLTDARTWLEGAVAATHVEGDATALTALLAKALNCLGGAYQTRGDFAGAVVQHERSLALFRELGDKRGISVTLKLLGNVAHLRGDYERALKWYEESLALDRELGDKRGIAYTLTYLGELALQQLDSVRARGILEESLILLRELADKQGIAYALRDLGDVATAQGDYKRALDLYEHSLTVAQESGNKRGMAHALVRLGDLARHRGHYGEAATRYRESLELFRAIDETLGMTACLAGLAGVICGQGQAERAARLFGAAKARSEATGLFIPPSVWANHAPQIDAARRALGDAAFDEAWTAGEAVPLEQALAEAGA